MIITAFINVVYAVVFVFLLPLRLLDDVVAVPDFVDSIQTAGTFIAPLNTFLPIGTLLIIFSFFISFEVAYFTYKGIMWLIKKIPTVN